MADYNPTFTFGKFNPTLSGIALAEALGGCMVSPFKGDPFIIKKNTPEDIEDHREYKLSCLQWSPDGKYLGIGLEQGACGFEIHDGTDGSLLKEVSFMKTGIKDITWAPNTQYFATINSHIPKVLFWDMKTEEPFGSLKVGVDPANIKKEEVVIYNDENEEVLKMEGNIGLGRIKWSSGKKLAIGRDNGITLIVEWGDEENIIVLDPGFRNSYTNLVRQLEWSPDDSKLAIVSQEQGKTIYLWSSQDWQIDKKIELDHGPVGSLKWSPDGKLLFNFRLNLLQGFDPNSGKVLFKHELGGNQRIRDIICHDDEILILDQYCNFHNYSY